ncbi:MAG: HAD-IC family P-type ATPase [Phycisphaerales bacterium]
MCNYLLKLDTALERAVSRDGIHVFARVSPAQKLRLVEAARRAGELVAVTGDGANDAPALKAANIGVAMGKSGTDAARESADLVIADDRLSTIVDGIEEGRVAYANIRKVVHLLVSTNCAEAILVIGAISLGLPLPLLPTQLLWLNLATEGLQDVALAFEPAERGVLAQPPRPARQAIFDRLMIERLLVGSIVIGGTSLWYFAWLIGQGVAEDDARNRLLLLMVLFENAQAGNSRSETRSVFASWPWTNPALLVAVAAGLALHVGAMHLPALRGVLATSPVSLGTFASCALLSLAALAAVELHKLAWSRRRRLVSRADHAPAA